MSLQFVFGNPIRRKKKAANPKKKGKSMAKKKKGHSRRKKNPRLHYIKDYKGLRHRIGATYTADEIALLKEIAKGPAKAPKAPKAPKVKKTVNEEIEDLVAGLKVKHSAQQARKAKAAEKAHGKKFSAAAKKLLKGAGGASLKAKLKKLKFDPDTYSSNDEKLTAQLIHELARSNPMKRRRKKRNPTIGETVGGVIASNPKGKKKKHKKAKGRKHTKAHKRRKHRPLALLAPKTKKRIKKKQTQASKWLRKHKRSKNKSYKASLGFVRRKNPIGVDLKGMAPKLGVAAVAGALIVASNKYALPMLAKVPVVGPLLNNKMAAPLVTAIPPSIAGIALLWLGDKQNNRMMKDIGEALLVASATAVGAGYANRLLPGGGMSGVDLTGVDMYGLPEMGATDFGDDVGDEYGDEYGDEVGATDFGATDFGATDFGETVGETVGDEYGDEYGDEVGDDYSGVELSGVSLMG